MVWSLRLGGVAAARPAGWRSERGDGTMDRNAEAVPRPVLRADAEGSGGSACLPEATGPLDLAVIDSVAGLEALRADWDSLFERAGGPGQVFQTAGFVDLIVRTHGLGNEHEACVAAGCSCRLAVMTARRGKRLVLVWPMVVRRFAGLRALTWLGEPIARYGDVLIDRDEPAVPLLTAAYAHALATLRPDIVRLRKVRADAAVAPFLATLGHVPLEPTEAPFVTLAAGGSAFESRQSGKARKNRRRLMRRLEEQGSVAMELPADGSCTTELVAAGLELKRHWLIRRGLVSLALADSHLDACLAVAAGERKADTGTLVFGMRLAGRPVAVALGFRCKSRLMLHLITHAPDVERHGAGVLNLEAILRWAEAEGLEAVDLLPPKADYKLDWADGSVGVADHVWGVTPRGRLVVLGIDRTVLPRLKPLLESLPLALRRRLATWSLRSVMR